MVEDYAVVLAQSERASDAGDADAQFNLGLMHGLGLGVQQDYASAVRWYRLAAESGHTRAQSNLGFMYGTGRGVPQDFVQAYAWYNVAAAGGEDVARRNRDILSDKMSAAQVEEAQRTSTELFSRIEGAMNAVPEAR